MIVFGFRFWTTNRDLMESLLFLGSIIEVVGIEARYKRLWAGISILGSNPLFCRIHE
jgi:hypothetical protein